MIITHDILLDMLLLLVNLNTSRTRKVIIELLKYYQKYKNMSSNLDYTSSQVNDKTEFENILVYLIKEIVSGKLVKDKNQKELKLLYSKVSVNDIFKKHPEWLDYIRDILANENLEISSTILSNINDKLSNILIWYRCNYYLKQMSNSLNQINLRNDSETSKDIFYNILDISSKLNSVLRGTKDISTLAIEKIRLNNKEDIKKAFSTFKNRNITGIFKFGLQGLNRMCGSRKGVGLGKSVLFCALTHNYKSTMLLNIARWSKEYNHFRKNKEGKKPLILHISLENEAHENMIMWYKHAAQTILPDNVNINEMSDDEIVNAIHDYFYSEDLEIELLRYLPNDFGFEELVDLITGYEDDGYYIPVCIIDYLRQMKLGSKDDMYSKKGNHLLIKDLFSKVCNYLKSKGITLFTAHQLNRNAASIVGSGVPYPVKRFNESCFEGSMDVAREVDMIIYMHIEKNHQGIPFLTLQWGKHRYEENTPARHKFIAYPFTEKGIVDDINGKFGGVKDIYSYSTEEENNENDNSGNQNIVVETSY